MSPTDETLPRDAGMSLAEILVAMTLLGVLTTLVAATSVLGLRVSSEMQERLEDTGQGEVAIMATSKVLRTAVLPDQLEEQVCSGCAETAIVRATPTEVSFYANLDNTGQGPSLVTLSVVEDPHRQGYGALRQRTQPPITLSDGRYSFCDPTKAGCVVNSRLVARGLVWPAPGSFSYYDFAGARIAATTLGATDLTKVASIDVTFPVRTDRSNAVTTAVQRVRLPNADINVLVQAS